VRLLILETNDMHDILRQRLLRRIETLPDAQVYQVVDFIEFLESKYSESHRAQPSGLQKFAEGLEDELRRHAVSPSMLREAFQLISSADRVLSDVARAGRDLLDEWAPAPRESSPPPASSSRTAPSSSAGEHPGDTPGNSRPHDADDARLDRPGGDA